MFWNKQCFEEKFVEITNYIKQNENDSEITENMMS